MARSKLKTLPPQAKKHSSINFTCPMCGPVDHLLFDADTLLERQFEGLEFLVKPGPTVEPRAEDEAYLDDFNMPKLLKQALEYAEDEPGQLRCPKCMEAVEE